MTLETFLSVKEPLFGVLAVRLRDKDPDSTFSSFSSGITHFSPAHLLKLSLLGILLCYLIVHFLNYTGRDSPVNPAISIRFYATNGTGGLREGKVPHNGYHKEVQCNWIQTSTEHFLSSVEEGISNHIAEHPRN